MIFSTYEFSSFFIYLIQLEWKWKQASFKWFLTCAVKRKIVFSRASCKFKISFSYFMIHSSISNQSYAHSINFIHQLWHLPIDYVRLDESRSHSIYHRRFDLISPSEINPYLTHTYRSNLAKSILAFHPIEYFCSFWKLVENHILVQLNNRSCKNKKGHSLTCTLFKVECWSHGISSYEIHFTTSYMHDIFIEWFFRPWKIKKEDEIIKMLKKCFSYTFLLYFSSVTFRHSSMIWAFYILIVRWKGKEVKSLLFLQSLSLNTPWAYEDNICYCMRI